MKTSSVTDTRHQVIPNGDPHAAYHAIEISGGRAAVHLKRHVVHGGNAVVFHVESSTQAEAWVEAMSFVAQQLRKDEARALEASHRALAEVRSMTTRHEGDPS